MLLPAPLPFGLEPVAQRPHEARPGGAAHTMAK